MLSLDRTLQSVMAGKFSMKDILISQGAIVTSIETSLEDSRHNK